MNKERKSLLFLVICFLIMFLVGTSQIGAAEVPKGTLTISGHESNLTLDPIATTMRVTITMTRPLMFDPLLTRDENDKIVPALATSWKAIDDTTWEFELRKGVKFHNGEPFNAQSVKATFDLLLDPTQRQAQGFLWSGIKDIEIIDDFTVRINTIEPMGNLLSNLTIGAMVPTSYDLKTFGAHPIGTGPFKFVEWVRGDHLTVEANLDYWGGPPKVEKVIWYPLHEEATRVATAMTGEIDIVSIIPSNMASIVEASPNVDLMTVLSCNTPHLALGGFGRPPIGGHDGKVLRAIEYAVDRERIAKEIYYGYAIPATAIMSPSVFGYSPIKWREYNPEKAKQLLAEVGWNPESKVEAWYVKGSSPNVDNLAVLIHSMLKEVGINLDIRVAPDFAVGGPILNQGKFDIFFESWNNYVLDADFYLWANFHPLGRNREGAEKYNKGKQLQELIEKGRFSVDQEVRKEVYAKAQEIIWEYPTRLPLIHYKEIYAVNKRVKGFKPTSNGVVDYTNISVEE